MKKLLLSILATITTISLFANVRLPKIFGDNMVFQRAQPIPVWGWADPGEKITIKFNQQVKTTKTDKSGKWMVRLDPEPAGGPYALSIVGRNTVGFNNVLVGEVWICSGQSNMEYHVRDVIHSDEEMQTADYPMIRHIKIPNAVSGSPQGDISDADWKVCSPETVSDFTAVGYFFARELFNRLHVPVGLINTSWGGTIVETWTSREAFEKDPEFKNMIANMPALNLDSLAKVKKDEMAKKLKILQPTLEEKVDATAWKNPDFDDSKWAHMNLPGLWESKGMGLEDLDGLVWFRKEITIDPEDADKQAVLELDKIDDSDDSYVNGTKVGSMKNQYNEQRRYVIPPGVLKPGRNVIAVRVEDTGGGGGIYGDSAFLKLSIGNKVIPLVGEWSFRIESILGQYAGIGPNSYPTLLFNAMVNPLIPYGIRGAIWYQGEANVGRAYQYRHAFPLMIKDWRDQWGQGNFPFYFVQLSSYNDNNGDSRHGSSWAELREAQTSTLALPNTGMAVTTDIGLSHDVHPKNKQDVGKRLAAIALNNVYGQTMEFSGPVYQSMKINGNQVILSFTHLGGGLVTTDKYGYVKGFEIAGKDQRFYYAKAAIHGSEIILQSDSVSDPLEVRYAWSDDAGEANLFNSDGFPAVPFRTDQWKGVTQGIQYVIGK
ncbi:MAG: hypothetical protein C5B59_14445 [Bacteroidetes bacterium]|nr:MAG: hypothetical protein C5B59_14445 [Bacteroidota bacterium]